MSYYCTLNFWGVDASASDQAMFPGELAPASRYSNVPNPPVSLSYFQDSIAHFFAVQKLLPA